MCFGGVCVPESNDWSRHHPITCSNINQMDRKIKKKNNKKNKEKRKEKPKNRSSMKRWFRELKVFFLFVCCWKKIENVLQVFQVGLVGSRRTSWKRSEKREKRKIKKRMVSFDVRSICLPRKKYNQKYNGSQFLSLFFVFKWKKISPVKVSKWNQKKKND